jgi:hypothetical protein
VYERDMFKDGVAYFSMRGSDNTSMLIQQIHMYLVRAQR